MAKSEIRTDGAPKPGGSYSQGIRAGDTAMFAGYDAVYRTYFPEPRPARSSVGTKLAGDFLVEIECVAVVPD